METMCAYRFRIYPTPEQQNLFERTFGCCRFVFNYYLAQRIKAYQETGITLRAYDQQKDLTLLKKNEEFIWLNEVSASALNRTVMNLDASFQNFFRRVRVKSGEKPGFPNFKKKQDRNKRFSIQNNKDDIRFEGNHVRIPKAGLVKCRISRPVEGRILSASISCVPSGHYFISLQCGGVEVTPLEPTGKSVGIDMGITTLMVMSDDKEYENPKFYEKSLKRLARAQRKLSRKQKGSANYEKQRVKVARIHEHVANQRSDTLHKISTDLIRTNDVIGIEDLSVSKMIRNRRLSRRIADASWRELRRQLEYKAGWYGRTVNAIDRYFKSSQTCSNCKAVNPAVKDLSVRTWTCPACGAVHHRDHNASKTVRDESIRTLALKSVSVPS